MSHHDPGGGPYLWIVIEPPWGDYQVIDQVFADCYAQEAAAGRHCMQLLCDFICWCRNREQIGWQIVGAAWGSTGVPIPSETAGLVLALADKDALHLAIPADTEPSAPHQQAVESRAAIFDSILARWYDNASGCPAFSLMEDLLRTIRPDEFRLALKAGFDQFSAMFPSRGLSDEEFYTFEELVQVFQGQKEAARQVFVGLGYDPSGDRSVSGREVQRYVEEHWERVEGPE